MTNKKRKTIASIGILFIILFGFFAAGSMLKSSGISEEYGKLVLNVIFIVAITGIIIVRSRW